MNNLPIKKENFCERVIYRFKSLFRKQNDESQDTQVINSETDISKMIEEYKINVTSQNLIEDIIKMIEENPKLLDVLDVPKLQVIDDYYKKKIMECKRKYRIKD